MKSKLLIIIFFIQTINVYSQSTIRVVAGQNLQTIIDNAMAGDIILVEAGSYGGISVSKRITLVGTGYNLNSSITAYIGLSILESVNFLVGSESSVIQGFQSGDINVGANGVIVQRNKCGIIRIGYNGSVVLKADNVLVRQNLSYGPEVHAQSIGFIIKNNLFSGGIYLETSGLGQILNNTFNYDSQTIGQDEYRSPSRQAINVEIKNNIFGQLYSYGYNQPNMLFCRGCTITIPFVLQYNVFEGSTNEYALATPYSETNKIFINFTYMYQAYPSNPNNLQEDARYQLAPNSPAKGAGENGIDCGAFGGDEPYVLSGIPSIPTIYQLTVPANVPQNGTLNVQIKAKTNN